MNISKKTSGRSTQSHKQNLIWIFFSHQCNFHFHHYYYCYSYYVLLFVYGYAKPYNLNILLCRRRRRRAKEDMKESAGADCTINSGCNCTCWVGDMWRRPLPNLFCVFRWIIHSPPNPFFIWGIIQRAIAKWRIFTEIDFFLSLLFLHFHTNIRTFQCCCIKRSTSRMDTVYFTPRLNTLKTQKSPTAATTSLRKFTK